MSKDNQEQGRLSAENGYSEHCAPDNPDADNKALEGDRSDSNTMKRSEEDGHKYPRGLTLAAIMTAMYLAMFLVALVGHPLGARTYLPSHPPLLNLS